jgi:replicative DNA helicase
MSKLEFSFPPTFQEDMLALMVSDIGFAMKAVDLIPPERLFSDAHRYLFEKIKEKVTTSGSVPSFTEIEDVLKFTEKHKRKVLKRFAEKIYAIKPADPVYIKDRLTEYAKKNAFVDIFQTAQTFWNSKKHDDAYTYTMEGINLLHGISFRDDINIPIEKFEEVRQIHVNERSMKVQKIPTKIKPLDDILRGGLEKGELGIILAEPKKGKSIGLIHMGAAALMTRFGRVAHFVLEGTTEQSILRYQARLAQIEYARLESDEITDEENKRLDSIGKKYMKKLDLVPFNKHWSYTVLDIESKIKEMERAGKKPDLIVVDYADLLKPSEKQESARHDQTAVYRALKQLAMIHKVAVWTASQARRPDEDPEKVYTLRAKDISESYEKVRIADLVVTLNQTTKEREMGILRFVVDIYRSNDTDRTIRMLTNFEKMIFYSKRYGHIDAEDWHDWMHAKKKKKT